MALVPTEVGGFEYHVHALYRLGKTIDVAHLIRDLKHDSSKWIKGVLDKPDEGSRRFFHYSPNLDRMSLSHNAAFRRCGPN